MFGFWKTSKQQLPEERRIFLPHTEKLDFKVQSIGNFHCRMRMIVWAYAASADRRRAVDFSVTAEQLSQAIQAWHDEVLSEALREACIVPMIAYLGCSKPPFVFPTNVCYRLFRRTFNDAGEAILSFDGGGMETIKVAAEIANCGWSHHGVRIYPSPIIQCQLDPTFAKENRAMLNLNDLSRLKKIVPEIGDLTMAALAAEFKLQQIAEREAELTRRENAYVLSKLSAPSVPAPPPIAKTVYVRRTRKQIKTIETFVMRKTTL